MSDYKLCIWNLEDVRLQTVLGNVEDCKLCIWNVENVTVDYKLCIWNVEDVRLQTVHMECGGC